MGIMDTVGYVGDVIDKATGARALRGLIGGRAREGLSVIPFSDTLGITDPSETVSGRNITDNFGLTDRHSNSFGSHASGFAADALLDPSNLIGGLGVRKLAKLNLFGDAAKAGARVAPKIGAASHDLQLFGDAFAPTKHMLVKPLRGQSDAVRMGAMVYGPRFPGGPDKIDAIRSAMTDSDMPGKAVLDQILGHDRIANRVAHEIPEGSRYLGSGGEATAIQAGPNHVIRIANVIPDHTNGNVGYMEEVGRANIREMLQPSRSVRIGPYRVEHMMKMNPLVPVDRYESKLEDWATRILGERGIDAGPISGSRRLSVGAGLHPGLEEAHRLFGNLENTNNNILAELEQRISAKGLVPWDVHERNVGLTPKGNAAVFDPGAVWRNHPTEVSMNPDLKYTTSQTPPLRELPGLTDQQERYLERLRGPESVRRALQQGLERLPQFQGIRTEWSKGYEKIVPDLERAMAQAGNPAHSIQAAPNRAGLAGLVSDFQLSPAAASGAGQGTKNPGRFMELRGGGRAAKGVPITPVQGVPANAQGKYQAGRATTFAGALNPSATARHEAGHLVVAQAVKNGPASISKLPLAWQPGAWAKYLAGNNSGSTLGIMGRYADEAAQNATQNRGLKDQALGALRFLADPRMADQYSQVLGASKSPLASALMQSIPKAWDNRVPISVGAMLSKDLVRSQRDMRRGSL